jgi:hypothetical protein
VLAHRPVAALGFSASAEARAADLARIDRTLKKEPVYRSKKPLYCLLAFGPEARARVWLVLDGDVLYVDRNGNSDLTEAGEKVAARKRLPGDADGEFRFEVGELKVGGKTHKGLEVALSPVKTLASNPNLMALPQVAAAVNKSPDALTGRITIDVECESLKGGGLGGRVTYLLMLFDTSGVFQLASKPAEAPVVHLDGPLQITFYGSKPTWTGGRSQDTILCLGTPGSGPGTFAMVKYEGTVPPGKHPKIAVTYRPKDPARKVVQEQYELKERC